MLESALRKPAQREGYHSSARDALVQCLGDEIVRFLPRSHAHHDFLRKIEEDPSRIQLSIPQDELMPIASSALSWMSDPHLIKGVLSSALSEMVASSVDARIKLDGKLAEMRKGGISNPDKAYQPVQNPLAAYASAVKDMYPLLKRHEPVVEEIYSLMNGAGAGTITQGIRHVAVRKAFPHPLEYRMNFLDRENTYLAQVRIFEESMKDVPNRKVERGVHFLHALVSPLIRDFIDYDTSVVYNLRK